jgi:ABC-2 type transport system permease protein
MTPSNAMPEGPLDSQTVAPAATSATRPMYWSVRRELWENRSIHIAPLVAAAVMLFGFSIRTIGLPHRMRTLSALDPDKQHAVLVMPYSIAASLIILTAYIVGVFYCLDALHGERRDRSILFWKSLPVSDLTTVLSKASVPSLFCR